MGGTPTETGGVPAATVPATTGGTTAATGGNPNSTGGTMTSTTAAGGTTSAGGAMGGAVAVGGTTAAGGSTAGSAKSGGTTAAGGMTVAGGAKTGGATAAGGTRATGGTPGTGGAPSTGGSPAPTNPGAPETKPLGYGQATTGGGSATSVDINSMSALQTAIDGYTGTGGLVIKYTGKFDFAGITDPCAQWNLPAQIVEIKKKSNITIMGADGSGANFGIHIASSSSNIIIRNMTFGLLPGGGSADAISLEGMSGGIPTNIWIDHNELFSSMAACAGAGDSSFDGLIDAKKGVDDVTISY
ncbi:MAG TPA: hypothetical protein VF518_07380, partial [Polyangia bacterium]